MGDSFLLLWDEGVGRTAHIKNDGKNLEEGRVVDLKHGVHKVFLGYEVCDIATYGPKFIMLEVTFGELIPQQIGPDQPHQFQADIRRATFQSSLFAEIVSRGEQLLKLLKANKFVWLLV